MTYVKSLTVKISEFIGNSDLRNIDFTWDYGTKTPDAVLLTIAAADTLNELNSSGALKPTSPLSKPPKAYSFSLRPGHYAAILLPLMKAISQGGDDPWADKMKDENDELKYREAFSLSLQVILLPKADSSPRGLSKPEVVGWEFSGHGRVVVAWKARDSFTYYNAMSSINEEIYPQIEINSSGTQGSFSFFPVREGDSLRFKVQGCKREELINLGSQCSEWSEQITLLVPPGKGYKPPLIPERTRISALSRNANHMSVFAVAEDKQVWEGVWTRNSRGVGDWRFWIPVGSQTFPHRTPVASVTRNPDQMDIYAVDADQRLMSDWWNGDPWRQWFPINTNYFLAGTPISVLSRTPDFMDLFLVGKDGGVYCNWWNGNPWRGWFRIGALKAAPRTRIGAVSRSPDFMDLFCVADNGFVYHSNWNGTWKEWNIVPGGLSLTPGTPITALRNDDDHISLYAVNTSGSVIYNLSNGGWQGWRVIGSVLFPQLTEISGVATDAQFIDLAALGSDGNVWTVGGNGKAGSDGWWNEWSSREGNIQFPTGTPVTIHKFQGNSIELFAVGTDGNVLHNHRDGTGYGWHHINK